MKNYSGIVTSTKMDKTVVVEVERRSIHPVYRKTVKQSKKFMVHDPKNSSKVGDHVSFIESKPISKLKRFILINNLE